MSTKPPISAAQARKVTKRAKTPRAIDPPRDYHVHAAGPFKMIAALCPGVSERTLRHRLDRGERDLMLLRRKPERKTWK